MKRYIVRSQHLFLSALLMATLASCANPFDPLDTSTEIRGLSYIDYSLTWAAWDSDPEGDGVEVEIAYFNEFGDSLSFNDKKHRVVIEFYTQTKAGVVETPEGGTTSGITVADELFFTFPVEHSNSDHIIRIPIEAYQASMAEAGYNFETCVTDEDPGPEQQPNFNAYVLVRVFPPQQKPQPELIAFYIDQLIFECEETVPPDETPDNGEGNGGGNGP